MKKNKFYFVNLILVVVLGLSNFAVAQEVIDNCEAYLFPKNKLKNGNYYSFMGRTVESQSVHSYVLKQKLSEFEASTYDICEKHDFSKLERILNANNFKHLITVYFDPAKYDSNGTNLNHVFSSNEFIDADALLVIGSSSIIGDSVYNLNLSLNRGIGIVDKLKGRKDIFLMNLGAFGQDDSKAHSEFYRSKRRSVSIYGLTYE